MPERERERERESEKHEKNTKFLTKKRSCNFFSDSQKSYKFGASKFKRRKWIDNYNVYKHSDHRNNFLHRKINDYHCDIYKTLLGQWYNMGLY